MIFFYGLVFRIKIIHIFALHKVIYGIIFSQGYEDGTFLCRLYLLT